jgi:glycerophosphoryl diester phosphodiesterase
MAAFMRAHQQGALAIELDVRTCAGGEVVVFHDATVSRASEGRDERHVRDVSLSDLRAMGVPTLDEALTWAGSKGVGVNVEMKHDGVDRIVLARKTARSLHATGADVLLSSFDPLLLAMAAARSPRVARALLVRTGQPLWANVLQQVARPPFVDALHIERTQAHPALARHLRKGLRLGVWTVNDPREAVHFVRLGVASIITDTPGEILKALTRS